MAAFSLTNLILAAGLGAAVLGFAYLAVRHSVATVAIVLVACDRRFALRDVIDLSVTVSSTRVFPLDLISAILVAVAVARALPDRNWNLGRILAFALLGLVAIHIARGVADSGLQTGFNYARSWLYFTAGLVYAATVPGGWDRSVWKVLIAGGALLTALAIPYFLIEGVSSASGQITRDGQLVNWRPIVAAGGLLIVQGAVLAVALGWPSRRTAICFAAIAGIVTLLLQHRTLWVAGLLVALVALIAWAARQERTRALVTVAAGLVLVVLPLGVLGFTKAEALVDSIKEPTSEQSTLVWRTDESGRPDRRQRCAG